MVLPENEDVGLLAAIASGDRKAFEEFFDRHSALVLGLLTKMLGRREAAEEVLQETFLQAWDKADRYRPERATPRGWLILLARSRAIDAIRSHRSRSRREEKSHRETEPLQRQESAEEALVAGERAASLHHALNRLPEEQRRCIELAFFKGLTHSQLAEELEQPLGTVKSRIALGMNKLRQELAG